MPDAGTVLAESGDAIYALQRSGSGHKVQACRIGSRDGYRDTMYVGPTPEGAIRAWLAGMTDAERRALKWRADLGYHAYERWKAERAKAAAG